jgi:hypothetical protein
LSHHPHRRAIDRLAQQGTQEAIILKGSEFGRGLRHGHNLDEPTTKKQGQLVGKPTILHEREP